MGTRSKGDIEYPYGGDSECLHYEEAIQIFVVNS